MEQIRVFCDGGARGNPGPAGVGVVILLPDGKEKRYKKFIGEATNNQAEYAAVLYALRIIGQKFSSYKMIDFFLDSELVVKQLKNEYKIKNELLGKFLIKIKNTIIKEDMSVSFNHISRSKNHHADELVNQVIDENE